MGGIQGSGLKSPPGVGTVTNVDGSITVAGTTDVVISLNTAHANTWTATQTFNVGAVVGNNSAGSVSIHFVNSATGTSGTNGSFIGLTSSGGLQFYNYANTPTIFANNNSEYMRALANGNVCINTTTGTSHLNIEGTDSQMSIIRTASNQYAQFFYQTDSGGTIDWITGVNANSFDYAFFNHTNLGYYGNQLLLKASGDSVFLGGNVGIQTTSPGYALDINTSVITVAKFGATTPVYITASYPVIGFNTYYDLGNKFGAGSVGNYGASIVGDIGSGGLLFQVTSSAGNAGAAATLATVMTITKNGTVGIATSTPGHALDVQSGGGSDGSINAGFSYFISGVQGATATSANTFNVSGGLITAASTTPYITGAAGLNGDIQYNNSGAFAGISGISGSGNTFTSTSGIITTISTASYGTVTSIGVTSSTLSIGSSPVTTSGTITVDLASITTGTSVTNANISFDNYGRITSASSGSGPTAPGGSSGNFQYNTGGIFSGASNVNYTSSGIGINTAASSYGIDVASNYINVAGTSGNTYRWGAATTAPSTSSLALPVSILVYGGTSALLGNPNVWVIINAGGTDIKLAGYT